jgi:hypothetical protein
MTSLSCDCRSRAGWVRIASAPTWLINPGFVLVFLIFGLPALATDSYELELLVFAVDTSPGIETALPGEVPVLLAESRMYRRSLSSKDPQILPRGAGRLATARKVIEARAGYHILAHSRIIKTPSSPFGATQYGLLSTLPEFQSRLTAYFRLYTTGPFFLQSTILYRPGLKISPAAGLSDLSQNLHARESLAIQETRRIRFNQVHYLDHPSFGALIVLTPKT